MIRNVFIDIDGVLNRFVTAALRHVGCNVPHDDRVFRPEWGWGIYKAVQHYNKDIETETEFWELLDRRFWSTIPLTEECWPIIERAVRLVGRENICLLSCPPRGPDQLAGKLEWIQQNMPSWLHRQYLFGPKKQFCAHPHHLLIDDADHNYQGFITAGGRALLVPRPWNANHDLPPLEYVTMRLDQLIERQASAA